MFIANTNTGNENKNGHWVAFVKSEVNYIVMIHLEEIRIYYPHTGIEHEGAKAGVQVTAIDA